MTGLEKILSQIENEQDNRCRELISEAEAKAKAIIDEANSQAEKIAADMETSLDFFSQEQDELTNLIFGDAKRFTFDSTGRIMLSEKLLKHAGITDTAVFVGKGRKFQIWNPQNWAKEEARIRAEVMKNRPVLKVNKDEK